MAVPAPLLELADEAIGRRHRADPVVGVTGGPAGNARLTAWTGVLLLALILAELVTVFDVSGLISWHIVIGTLLVPLALLKTASTTWRAARYYSGHQAYRSAGPPLMPLRLLGPLVVATTLGLLGSGLALIALGPEAGRRPFVTVLGFGLDTLTLHQALFIAFAVATGLHLLARIVPAVSLLTGRIAHAVPGRSRRITAVLATLTAAAVTSALVLSASTSWRHDAGHPRHRAPGIPPATATR
jgi:hypothetical protein